MRRIVAPRFLAARVALLREEAIRAAHRHVEDEKELLVEGGVLVARLPRILAAEVAASEETVRGVNGADVLVVDAEAQVFCGERQ